MKNIQNKMGRVKESMSLVANRTRALVSIAVAVGVVASASAIAGRAGAGGILQQKNPNVNYIEATATVAGHFTVPVEPIPKGNAEAKVTAVDYASVDSGCTAADFAGFPAGNIALVKRGTCTFSTKVINAQNAGASGVLIANNIPGLVSITLSSAAIEIPVLFLIKDLGDLFASLSATGDGLKVHMLVKQPVE